MVLVLKIEAIIPAPHVVAARAYRLASKKRSASIFGGSTSTTLADNTPTVESGCQIPGFSGCGSSSGVSSSDQQHSSSSSSNTTSGFSNSNTQTNASNSSSTSSSSTSNIALTRRLVKLLHQSSSSISSKSQHQQQHHQQQQHQQHHYQHLQQQQQYDMNFSGLCAIEDAPRRLSWERRKDSSALQRSASIDSFAEVVWSDSPRPSLEIPRPVVAPFSKRPSASSLYSNCSASSQSAQLNINELSVGGGMMGGSGGGGAGSCGMTSGAGLGSSGNIGVGGAMVGITTSANNRRESLLSPSSTRRNKLTRIINGKSEEMLDLNRNLCGEKVCSLVMKGKEKFYGK
ncbi:uncharacterized protein DDB_G0271670-like [Musca domestica]|uniref:Uncharacterized protein DDB_G0271670-like n=1 Tax=Musca domestica TaxID=7370 RepID=A0ABM3VDN1_MUSDO|nr:uncharacterized protein DDB_G0271670-like [Musca domestica]